jgi:hypothetical protein
MSWSLRKKLKNESFSHELFDFHQALIKKQNIKFQYPFYVPWWTHNFCLYERLFTKIFVLALYVSSKQKICILRGRTVRAALVGLH